MYDRPSYPGGPIINYVRLLPRLVDLGYEVHVLVLYKSDYPNARILEHQLIQIHPHPFISNSNKAVMWILKKAQDIQPDIYIADVSTPGCFAGKWLQGAGIAVVNSHRGNEENNRGKAIYFSDPQFGFTTDAIFCVSKYLLNDLLKKINNPGLFTCVIPSGVPVSQKYSIQDGQTLKIVYAGRLVQKHKRITDIVQLFIHLARLNRSFEFTFIGNGPDKEKCENLVTFEGMQDRVHFTGLLQGKEYQDALARHDVILLLSDFEGTPGALLDGMAAGLIPVCYHYPGAEELITQDETGFLVTDRFQQVVEVFMRLAEDNILRKRISENARNLIINQYSIEIVLDKWNMLIKCLLDNPRSQRSLFKAPNEISLPPQHPLLMEHVILRQPSMLALVRDTLKIRTRLKSFAQWINYSD